MQLVGPGVAMYDPAGVRAQAREERRIGPAEVFAYFGVRAEKVIDVQALAGDSTDNVPGAPRHRRQDRRAAHQRIWRSRHAARTRRRDQTAEAPRDPDQSRDRRADPPVEAARHARPGCRARSAARRSRRCRRRTPSRWSPFSRRWNSPRSPDAPPKSMASRPARSKPDPAFVGAGGWRGRNGEAVETPPRSPTPRADQSRQAANAAAARRRAGRA